MDKKGTEMLMIGLGSGLLLGALLGILLAPFSGKKLRMKLTDVTDDIHSRVNMFREPEKYSRIKA